MPEKPGRKNCAVCGTPLAVLRVVLSEYDPQHQCPHCWSVIGVQAPEAVQYIRAQVPGVLCRRPRLRQAAA